MEESSSPERVKLPLYEYCCAQCGYRFEKIQKFDAEPETACTKCGGELYRPLTVPALQFKGAGWYVNDYAPKGASSSSDKPAADAAAGGDAKPSTESKPAESKPAAAAESSPKPAATPSPSSTA
jgi:putative FmdB family regulatory protein